MAQNSIIDQDSNSIKKIGIIEPKNDSMIHDAQYDYYGKRLATGTADGQITIYDVSKPEKSQKLVTFQAHNGPIWQVTWGHPRFGTILASCSFDKKVAIWKEVKSNEWYEIKSHYEHTGSVNGIAWAPWELGLQLAACGSDGLISILTKNNDDTWDQVITAEAHEMGVNAISWAPLSNLEDFSVEQFSADNKFSCKIATASCDNTVKIWRYNQQTKKFTEIQKFEEHKEWVRDVAWNPSIGATFDIVASCSEDCSVIIRKLDKKNLSLIEKKEIKFEGPVWHVSWSLQGNMLAVSSASNNSDNICNVYSENPSGDWDLVKSIDTQEEQQQQLQAL